MKNSVTQYLNNVTDMTNRIQLEAVLLPVSDRMSSQSLTSAALRIVGGSASPLAETNAVYVGSVDGALVTLASGDNMAALAGTVTADLFNVYAFFIDKASTVTTSMGIEGATLAAVKFPPLPEKKALIGFVIVNPTGTGNFVGGTTDLDDATVVPNAVFVNTQGAFDPSVVL